MLNVSLRSWSFGVVPVLDAFESSLSVALNSPRILRVRDEAADGRPMGDEKADSVSGSSYLLPWLDESLSSSGTSGNSSGGMWSYSL